MHARTHTQYSHAHTRTEINIIFNKASEHSEWFEYTCHFTMKMLKITKILKKIVANYPQINAEKCTSEYFLGI